MTRLRCGCARFGRTARDTGIDVGDLPESIPGAPSADCRPLTGSGLSWKGQNIMSGLNGRGVYVWQEITPDDAAEWLAKNAINRPVRRSAVIQYAADMAAGDWREADAPITRRADGVLLDGQHRLSAIIASGVTIGAWVHIVSDDVDPMTLRVDVGKPRSIVDITGVTTRQAATARQLLRMASTSQTHSIDVVHGVIERIAPEYDQLTHSTRRGLSGAGIVSAACFSINANPSDSANIAAQFDAMVLGQFDYPFWPAVASGMRQCIDDTGGQMAQARAFVRMVRAFSPKGRASSRVTIKDLDARRAELAPKVAAYIGVA